MARTFDIEMGTVRPDGSVKVEQRQARLQKYERIGVTQIRDSNELFGVANLQKEPATTCLPLVSQAILGEIEHETLANVLVEPTPYIPKFITTVLPLPKMPPRIVFYYRVAKVHVPCLVCGGMTLVRCVTDHLFKTTDVLDDEGCHIRCGNGYAIREARAQPNRHERARQGLPRPETPEWVKEMLR